MAKKDNNAVGVFIKILIGMFLAILLFMSYMLAEQRGWVGTNVAEEILKKVEDGKANNAAEKAKKDTAEKNAAETKKSVPAAEKSEEKAPEIVPESKNSNEESASEENSDEENGDPEEEEEEEENSDEQTSEESSLSAKKSTSKKIDFAVVSKKKAPWPNAVEVRVDGTNVLMRDNKGIVIGKVGVPKGTRLFVKNVSPTGILEVADHNGKVFEIHASRTTFRKLYTGKPISASVARSSAGTSKKSSSKSDDYDFESDDSEDEDSPSDDDDDFFDDDF